MPMWNISHCKRFLMITIYDSKLWALFYVLKLFYYKMHRLAYIYLRNFKATIDHLCILLTLVQDNFKIAVVFCPSSILGLKCKISYVYYFNGKKRIFKFRIPVYVGLRSLSDFYLALDGSKGQKYDIKISAFLCENFSFFPPKYGEN